MPCRWFFGFWGLIRRLVNARSSHPQIVPPRVIYRSNTPETGLIGLFSCKWDRHGPAETVAKVLAIALPGAGCISGLTCYLAEIATDFLLFGAVVAKSRSIVESINNGA
jgi:hypothetical protein